MNYEIQDQLLSNLVGVLVPSREDVLRRPEILDGKNLDSKESESLF